MVDTGISPALGYMCTVPDRSAATLLPIIQQHVLPGTTIASDEWRAYRNVPNITNVASHQTVNHSVNFVDPTGTHTQNIESYWSRAKFATSLINYARWVWHFLRNTPTSTRDLDLGTDTIVPVVFLQWLVPVPGMLISWFSC